MYRAGADSGASVVWIASSTPGLWRVNSSTTADCHSGPYMLDTFSVVRKCHSRPARSPSPLITG